MAPVAALAEDAPAARLDSVVVTGGLKSSNARTIATKRDALQQLDTIAADEIGRLPDFNVGDALKRVTGVNTLLYQGEPRFVIVRGLNANYNATLIDGFAFATADIGGRQVFMEVLPSNFAQRIDVTKSFMPQSDGGAIGGVVDIVTASAFSLPPDTLNLSLKAGKNLMDGRYGGSTPIGEAQAQWARRFGPDDAFGWLTTASVWYRDINVPQIESGGSLNWYNANGSRTMTPYGGNGVAVPTERRWYDYENKRTRTGLTTRLDWQPAGAFSGHASAFYFKQREDSDRHELTAAVNTNSTVSNQTPTSGRLSSVNQTVQLGRLLFDRALYGANGELNYEPAPLWTTNLRASWSKASVDNPQIWDRFTQSNLGFDYDWSGTAPRFSALNAVNANNPSRHALNYHRNEETTYDARVSDLQLNARYNAGDDSRGWGAATGARRVATLADTAFTRTSWSGSPYTLANVLDSRTLCGNACNSPLPVIDPALADQQFAQYAATATASVDTAAQFGGTYGYREDVNALYGQGQYRADLWRIAGGLRVERTRLSSGGFLSTAGTFAPAAASQRYTDVLPSLVASLDTSEAGRLRLGVSRSVGRPRFDQVATRGGALVTSGSVPTLTQGNADLKPRRSTNVDLGHDWVLDGGRGIASVALFHKRIRDEIFNFGQTETIAGVATPVLVTKPRNVADTVKLSGIELGLTKDFDFLPSPFDGFGMSANATFTRASYPVTLTDGSTTTLAVLPQQPRQVWNLTLYYEQGPWRARLAWNHLGELWDDRFPNYTALGFYANRYQQPTDNFDVQLAYQVDRKLSITLDGLNLSGQGLQYNFGRSQEVQQSAWKLAPSALLGLNYKL